VPSRMPSKLLFLPGASGNTNFWRPVSDLITHQSERVFLGWPGIGATPAHEGDTSIDAFVARTVAEIDQPTALIAQSMGGVIAILAAHQRPKRVTHLVLAALSGGVDTIGLGAKDWRPQESERTAESEFVFVNFTASLQSELIAFKGKTLLLWGDSDLVSPVQVGQHVASLVSGSKLFVIPKGGHGFANTHAADVAQHINEHLSAAA
jgi:poly(3-hydroxyoctanoate) depolymerase